MPEGTPGDRTILELVCRQLEAELLRIGGGELVDDARTEAEWYAALFFPFDGCGTEPVERLRARVSILTERLDRAGPARDELG